MHQILSKFRCHMTSNFRNSKWQIKYGGCQIENCIYGFFGGEFSKSDVKFIVKSPEIIDIKFRQNQFINSWLKGLKDTFFKCSYFANLILVLIFLLWKKYTFTHFLRKILTNFNYFYQNTGNVYLFLYKNLI